MPGKLLVDIEALVLTGLVMGGILAFVIKRMRLRRPALAIGRPIVVGVGLRFVAIAGINSTGVQDQLRGGDESTFLAYAHAIAATPWGRGFLPHGSYQLQTEVFAFQIKLVGLSPTALRVTQIGMAMLGVVLIVAAVHDLAGPRAARFTAWILALEPASIFFNSGLTKEPLMLFASGLVVFGGTKFWRRMDPAGALLVALGGLIAVETRSYAGWFLVSAAVLLTLHAALRRLDRPGRAMPIIYVVVVIVFLAAPTLLSNTSSQRLRTLQQSQNYTTGAQAASNSGAPNGDNLAYESVDLSTRGAVIRNLPIRLFDIVFKPFPWQLQDPSQQLGAVGSVVALGGLLLLFGYAWRSRGQILRLTAPVLYPLLFLLVAYALAAGNAGTGFRYRTHLVVLGVAMLAILREHVLVSGAESLQPAAGSEGWAAEPRHQPPVPV
ncbi:MAG: hypothetical protein ACJ780_29125 [Solirubrobacteraceae bacterium]